MQIDLIAMFILGFLSSFSHCYGMCGGFVMAYSIPAGEQVEKRGSIVPHLMYNTGRIITYMFLGFWFGLAGNSFKLIVTDYQNFLFIFAGLFMFFVGFELLGVFTLPSLVRFPAFAKYKKFISSLLSKRTSGSIFLYGLVLGFIPCGLVYVAGAEAVAAASGPAGMAVMLAFGLGTMPALFLLGYSAHLVTVRFRRYLLRVAAVFLILFGLFTVTKGIYRYMDLPVPWMNHSGKSMEHHHDH